VSQRFHASRDEFFVDDLTNDLQFDPKIAALEGGGFVVTWWDLHLDSVQAQRFDSDGVAIGPSFAVADLNNSSAQFAVTGLESGGFAISWVQTVAGTTKLGIQLYDSAGAAQGAPIVPAQTLGSSGTIPSITGLASGGFVVVYDRSSGGQIGARLFDASGQAVGGEVNLTSSGGFARLNPTVLALPGGGFAMTWEVYNSSQDRDIRFRTFDSAGAPLGAEVVVASGLNNQMAPRLTLLASGGMVLTWEERGPTDWSVAAQLFDPAGAKVGSPFLVNTVTAGDQRSPTVSALGDGFVIAWSDGSGQGLDTYGTAIKAQVFGASGVKIGEEYVVNSHKAGSQTAPVLAALADGSIAAVWVSGDNVFPSPYIGLRAKVLDFVTVTETIGTGNADSLTGTAGPDDISGLGGDDTISGGAGDDVILGGDGVDNITGGDGDDRIDGGIGDDRIDGGKGDDLIFGGEGNDTLVYFGTPDTQGIDRLDGGAGNDLFDVYLTWARGSTGVTLIGGDGDDRFVIDWRGDSPAYGITAITIDAGPGSDRIEIESLQYRAEISLGSGVDTISLDELIGYSWFNLDSTRGGIYINDFAAGAGGDRLRIQSFLEEYLAFEWDGASNPFASGYMKLEQRGPDAFLLLRMRLEYDFSPMFVFRNVDAATLTIENLDGIPPDGSPFPSTFDVGGENGDQIHGTMGADTLDGAGGNDFISGRSGHDVLYGGEGSDSIDGGNGDDVIEGGAGGDFLDGGFGNDTIRGGADRDTIDGGGGDDWIDGGLGPDYMYGNAGSDTYVVDDSGDEVLEYAGYGETDLVLSSVSFTLPDEVEDLTLTGSAANGTGNALSNLILGNGGANILDGRAGDDILDGGGGVDTMTGGAGADLYRIGEAGDLAVEQASGGIDSVETALAAYTLTANVENLVGTGAAQSLTGNGINNQIAGTGLNDVLAGEGGNDVLWGGLGADSLNGGSGNDILIGGLVGATELIVGGSFEAQYYGYFSSALHILQSPTDDGTSYSRTTTGLTGWTIATGVPIDLHMAKAGSAFETAHGAVLVDMESASGVNQRIFQDVSGVAAGTRLLLTFAAALPAAGGTSALDVYWNGIKVSTVVPTSTEMTQNAVFVTASAGANRLEFREVGTAGDGHGTALDMVSLRTVTATADPSANDLNGGPGNDLLIGDDGNDVIRLYEGGNDTVLAGAGNDSIFSGAALTAADYINGGSGVDTLVLQGPYGSLTLTANIIQIENISILGGNNVNFGEPGTNRYDYVLTTNDSNFAAGVQARINGSALLEGEDFTFNGSAETDAKFVVYGGKGVDTLTGGLGNDIFFYAEERFASGDTVNGGAGYDGMFLRGNYTIDFNAPGYTGLFTNIENLTLTSATDERYARGGGTEFDYSLTLSDAVVGAGQLLTVSGALLMATETMILDGSQETNGRFNLFGGASADTLKGGANADLIHGNLGADALSGGGGADSFRYQSTAESTAAAMDQITDFTPGTDRIELDRIDARTDVAGDQAFTWIGSAAFSGVAGQLRAFESAGTWFVQGDVDGDGVADLVIALTLQGPTPLSAADFLL
jgi:Ca2+-binding RTX toxin-like protein